MILSMSALYEKLKFTNIITESGKISNVINLKFQKFPNILDEIKEATAFLPLNRKFELQERICLIKNNLTEIPKCKECFEPTSFNNSYKKYNDFCSNYCARTSKLTTKKIKDTSLSRYGVSCTLQEQKTKEKRKNTMIKKYGVEYTMQSSELKNKIEQNNIKKYGKKNTGTVPLFVEKRNKTIKDRYGVDHYSQTDEFKIKIENTNFERYGKHQQQRHISDDNLKKLNDKNWLYNRHIVEKKLLTEIADELQVDDSTIVNYLKKFKIDTYRWKFSSSENKILEFLSNYVKDISHNNRILIKPYEVDILCTNLAIEYCGLIWHSEIAKDKNYHKMKYDMCKEKGIRLIQIFEDEWLQKEQIVKNKLLNILGVSTQDKIFARKTIIKEISKKEKSNFFNNTHIQGDGPSSINYGLFHNDELVAAIAFIKQKNNEYILNRYSTSCNVIGGFSKLLSHFEKQFKPSKIITFADLRWSEGDLYEKTGFIVDKILKPDYQYINKQNRYHKFNFRHKSMKNKLKNYEPSLSEHQNMLNNKFYKIYDCGKIKFIKEYT